MSANLGTPTICFSPSVLLTHAANNERCADGWGVLSLCFCWNVHSDFSFAYCMEMIVFSLYVTLAKILLFLACGSLTEEQFTCPSPTSDWIAVHGAERDNVRVFVCSLTSVWKTILYSYCSIKCCVIKADAFIVRIQKVSHSCSKFLCTAQNAKSVLVGDVKEAFTTKSIQN